MATKTEPVASPEMMNSIRNEASDAYQRAVPEATPTNLTDVGNPILNYEAIGNEFISALLNKIVLQLVERKMWSNPLAMLKTEEMPLGTDIEDIHTNPAKGTAYDGTENGMADLLKMHKPDVATMYYRLNRREKYPVTVEYDLLRGAFTGWNKLNSLIDGIVDSLYNGCSIDDFNYTKQLVSNAVAANQIVTQNVANPTNEATGKAFMKALQTLSVLFTCPSTAYNSYAQVTGNPPRTNWCTIDDQIIIMRADVAASVGVDVLSAAFNLSYSQYLARQVVIDNFGDEKTLCVLADRKAFIIKEQLRRFATFENASSLSRQYYYHAWDLFAFSLFRNAVAFTIV